MNIKNIIISIRELDLTKNNIVNKKLFEDLVTWIDMLFAANPADVLKAIGANQEQLVIEQMQAYNISPRFEDIKKLKLLKDIYSIEYSSEIIAYLQKFIDASLLYRIINFANERNFSNKHEKEAFIAANLQKITKNLDGYIILENTFENELLIAFN